MKGIKIGYAVCGSFCTFSQAIPMLEQLAAQGADITPVMSCTAYSTSTRFGRAEDFVEMIEAACGKAVIHTIDAAEPIGPKKLLDVLVVAPCTGNTLAKLAMGITDTPVTMAAKAHLRNGRPLVLAVATNDGLASSARNIGQLMNTRNVYFVPFGQDDCHGKPCSLIAHFERIPETIQAAMEGRQLQPLLQ